MTKPSEGDEDGDERRDGDAEEVAAAEPEEARRVGDRDRVALGQPEREAADDREAGEGDDEGLHLLVGDEPALGEADQRAEDEHQDDGGEGGDAVRP